jgi:hypothetical protein
MIGLIFAAAVALSPPCRVPTPTQHHHVARKAHRKPICGTPVAASTPFIGPAPTFITIPAEPELEPLHVVTYYVPVPVPTSNNTAPPDEFIIWEPAWDTFMIGGGGGGGVVGVPATVLPVAVTPVPRLPVYPPLPGSSVAVNRAPELDMSAALIAVTSLAIAITLLKERAS